LVVTAIQDSLLDFNKGKMMGILLPIDTVTGETQLMNHRLIDRFRGLFLGVAVVEIHLQEKSYQNSLHLAPEQGSSPLFLNPPRELGWSEAMATSTQALVKGESLPSILASDCLDKDNEVARQIAKILPVALFYHENLPQMQEQICEQIFNEADCELKAGVMAVGIAIALLCCQQANPKTLISYLLKQGILAGTLIHDHLTQVQELLNTQASLTTVYAQLAPAPSFAPNKAIASIALAFYCGLSTADSFVLTLRRFLRLPQPPLLSALLMSAMSGVLNSLKGIPLDWQTPLFMESKTTSPLCRQNILSSSAHLWSLWCGYYTLGEDILPHSLLEESAISAPALLRSCKK
jgi:hypothetical protein